MPPSPFEVYKVSATPGICCSNTAGVVAKPGTPLTIWAPDVDYTDGTTGSREPVTLQIPQNGPLGPLPISLDGNCVFVKELATKRFQVVGSLSINGQVMAIFRDQDPTHVVLPTGVTPVICKNFTVDTGFLDLKNYLVPFRIAGDFEWKITMDGQPDIVAGTKTRLEFAFARATAPSGPWDITYPTAKTLINLYGVYPVALQRFFYPMAAEFRDKDFAGNEMPWYLRRTVQTIWAWGNTKGVSLSPPQYDATNGSSFFAASNYGGSVDFDGWLAGTKKLCNCYDLAAMVQLGFSLLLDIGNHNTTYEPASSCWVFQSPTGFVNRCLLYGWANVGTQPPDFPSGLNNPFHLIPGSQYIGSKPFSDRWPFRNHAWIEAYTTAPGPAVGRKVFDCTTATWELNDPKPVAASPDVGTRSRKEYIQAHIDKAADPGKNTGNDQEWLQASQPSTGSCHVNETAWMVLQAEPNKKYRIGVWGISKIPYPLYLQTLLSGSLPSSMMEEIEATIAKVSPPQGPGHRLFSDASVSVGQITSILAEQSSQLRVIESSVHVTGDSSLVEMIIDQASVLAGATGRIVLQLHTFNDASLAYATLIHTLSSYATSERLPDMFDAPRRRLGSISMTDRGHETLYFVQGNHFVSQRYIDNDPLASSSLRADPATHGGYRTPSPTDPDHITGIAERLSDHLAAQEVEPGKQRQPHLRLHAAENETPNDGDPITEKTVRRGEAFTLYVSTPDTPQDNSQGTFAALRGETDDGAVVVYSGRVQNVVDSGGRMHALEFLAMAEGQTDVYVYAAHQSTLAPGSVRCTVKVVQG